MKAWRVVILVAGLVVATDARADGPDAAPAPAPAPALTLDAAPAAAPPPAADHTAPAAKPSTGSSPLFAIKIIAGLTILLALAYLGGHRTVIRFEQRLGLSNVAAAGFPFLALGLIASHPSIGILGGNILHDLEPVLRFGLGWVGFLVGAQLDIRVLDRVPRGTAYLVLVEAITPFAFTAAACGALMVGFGASWRDPSFWRDLVLLGTAAAMTAPRRFHHGFANRSWREGQGVDVLIGQLDEVVGVVGLLFMTAYFRDLDAGAWRLPGTAWLFVSIGIGVVCGVLIFVMVRLPVSNAEFLAVVLGGIAFSAGLAGYLGLSPIVIGFVAGVLVVNFPCEQRQSVFRILVHLERPVHLLFLIVLGALWGVSDWRGWVLVPVFVFARIAGKWVGVFAAHTKVGSLLPHGFADDRHLVVPMSSLAIALVVDLQSQGDPGVGWIVTAVVGAAIATEVLVQVTGDDSAPQAAGDPDRIDELDDDDHDAGPIYDRLDDDHGGKP